jgi:anti-anti-sigma regulatory factor
MPPQPDGEDRGLKLPSHGSTTTAEDLRVRLVLACDYGGGIEIDASEVESVGQAVLQLLVAAKAETERTGLPFAFTHPSPAFIERVQACRLADAIGLSPQEDFVP